MIHLKEQRRPFQAQSTYRLPAVKMDTVRRLCRVFSPIARYYFRFDVRGIERLPRTQSILVGNHDGGMLPVDAACLYAAWHEHHRFAVPLHVLTHEILHAARPVARLWGELGMILADRHAMDAALGTGRSVLVFPGAARETFRTYAQRRNIDLGGRAGFIAQAIRWRLPITPVVSVGAHDTLFVLASGYELARKLGIPSLVRSADVFPLVAGLPWGIWAIPCLPQLPLPAKITTEVLEPIWLPEVLGRPLTRVDAEDPEVLGRGFSHVLARMRACVNRLYDERRFPVLG